MNRPESSIRANASSSWGRSGADCARTSMWVIGGTASHGNRANPTQDDVRREQRDSDDDGIVDVPEALVHAVPARTEGPTRRGPGEAPDRASDRGQDRIAHERRLEDARGDRD